MDGMAMRSNSSRQPVSRGNRLPVGFWGSPQRSCHREARLAGGVSRSSGHAWAPRSIGGNPGESVVTAPASSGLWIRDCAEDWWQPRSTQTSWPQSHRPNPGSPRPRLSGILPVEIPEDNSMGRSLGRSRIDGKKLFRTKVESDRCHRGDSGSDQMCFPRPGSHERLARAERPSQIRLSLLPAPPGGQWRFPARKGSPQHQRSTGTQSFGGQRPQSVRPSRSNKPRVLLIRKQGVVMEQPSPL